MRNLLLAPLLFFSLFLAAQDTVRHVGEFPASRYAGGSQAFYQCLGKSLKYPPRAKGAARIGTSIVELTVPSEGKFASLKVINPLGKGIDENILRTFQKTEDQWLARPGVSPIRMYFYITYIINKRPFYRVAPDSTLFQQEVSVNAYGSIHLPMRSNARLVKNLHKFQERKKFKRALKVVNELIRRDPLNSQWYLQRSSINDALGHREAVCQDLSKLRHFLKVPVAEELMRQYCD